MTSLLISRLCCSPSLRVATIRKLPVRSFIRNYARDTKESVQQTARRRTLRESAMAPAGETGLNYDIETIKSTNENILSF